MACRTPVDKQNKNRMQVFGITSLVFVGILITIWIFDPIFFSSVVIPWAIFITIGFVSIMALVTAANYCSTEKSKKQRRK